MTISRTRIWGALVCIALAVTGGAAIAGQVDAAPRSSGAQASQGDTAQPVSHSPAAASAQSTDSDTSGATPQEAVARLHAALLDAMRHADELGYIGRYRKLRPVVEQLFDLPQIAQRAVRGYWDKFSPAQQQAYLKAFTRLSVAEYARRFDAYNGQHFKVRETRPMPGGYRRVNADLVQADGDTISLDYVLSDEDGQWRIINVIAQGVSELAQKRGQYLGVLKKQGTVEFLARIQKQADKARQGNKEPPPALSAARPGIDPAATL